METLEEGKCPSCDEELLVTVTEHDEGGRSELHYCGSCGYEEHR